VVVRLVRVRLPLSRSAARSTARRGGSRSRSVSSIGGRRRKSQKQKNCDGGPSHHRRESPHTLPLHYFHPWIIGYVVDVPRRTLGASAIEKCRSADHQQMADNVITCGILEMRASAGGEGHARVSMRMIATPIEVIKLSLIDNNHNDLAMQPPWCLTVCLPGCSVDLYRL